MGGIRVMSPIGFRLFLCYLEFFGHFCHSFLFKCFQKIIWQLVRSDRASVLIPGLYNIDNSRPNPLWRLLLELGNVGVQQRQDNTELVAKIIAE